MSEFAISRDEFLRRWQLGQVRFDSEHMTASVADPDAFRFGWRWSWLRMWWVPFDNMTAPQDLRSSMSET